MYRHDPVISVAPMALISGEGVALGRSITGRKVSIPDNQLGRHLLVLGKTGTGKSNVLKQIISSIIESGKGSVVIFDPHGGLGISMATAFPDKALVISPNGFENNGELKRFSLNAISLNGAGERNQIAAGWVKDAFSNEGVFSQGTWGPRLELVFTSILQELLKKDSSANLSDLLELLVDTGKMRRFISTTENQQLKAFLKMQVSDWRGWNQYVTSSINKLLPLVTDEGIRDLISGRNDSLDLSGVLSKDPTILVPEVWKDVVPEESFKIITVLMLLKIWMQRLDSVQQPDRLPIYLVFDEAQLVPSRILDRLLREGRKFGLRVIMATQFIGSDIHGLSETIRGNVSSVISFNLFEKDAQIISSNFFTGPVHQKLTEVLKSQALHRSVVWSQGERGISGPQSFTPFHIDLPGDSELFRRISRMNTETYGVSVKKTNNAEDETELHEFLILELQKFLQKKSIDSDRNQSVMGIYPDLFFSLNSVTFFVEVEVSDLLNFGRIGEKILNYADRKLVFVVPPGASMNLFRRVLDYLVKYDAKVHRKLRKESMDVLTGISILEYDNGFFFLASGRLRRLRTDHLFQGSFRRSLTDGQYGEIRSYVYSMMTNQGTFRIEFPQAQISRIFGENNARNASRYLIGDSTFITLQDLFRLRANDSQAQ